MKKLLILPFLFCYLNANDDWRLWLTDKLDVKFHKSTRGILEIENRFKNNFTEFYYFHIHPEILFKTFKNNYIGAYFRHIFEKSSETLWLQESQPTFTMINNIKIKYLNFSSRLLAFARLREQKTDRGAIRARLGCDVKLDRSIIFYTTNEIFYHYNGFNQIDRNRFAIGIKGKLKVYKASFEISPYYMREINKSQPVIHWDGFNVLGLGITGKF